MRAIVTVALCLAFTLPVGAGDCRRAGYYGGYSATYTPSYHVQSYGYETIFPYAIPVAVVPYTYYQVAPDLANARLVQVAAEDAATKASQKTLQDFLAAIQQQQRPNPGPLAPPGSPQENVAAKAPNPNVKPAMDVVRNMVQTMCIQCHGQGSGHLDLTDVGKLNELQWFKMEHRLMSGDPKVMMPPPSSGKKPVSPEELDAVHAAINGLKK